jgi:small subunit ribosomal protein S20
VANIRSQIKRNRQNERRRVRNKAVRSELKTHSRRFREALESGDRAAAEDAYRVAARAYDKAVSKSVIHRNKAANEKSKMARELQQG